MEGEKVETTMEAPTQTEEKPTLSAGDLQNAITVINLACKRGAFQAGEMKQIGEVHDKLDAYIKSLQ